MLNPFPAEELRLILPVLILFGTATIVLVVDLFLRSWNTPGEPAGRKGSLAFLSIAGTLLACIVAFRSTVTEPVLAFRGAIQVDLFSSTTTGIILLGTLLTLVASCGAARRLGVDHGEFYSLLLFAAGAMALLAQSNNLIMVFVSLETFSMAVYVLAAYTRDAQRSVEGAMKYFILGGVSSGFLLLGLVFLYGATGDIRLDTMGRALAAGGESVDGALLVAGLGLSLIGFGFKVGAFPFHSWVPDAYEGAPSLVTSFMSVTVKTAAFAVLVRIGLVLSSTDTNPSSQLYLTETLWWLAAATMVFGNLVALVQQSVKRMLAYSAISHSGYLLLGLVAALKTTSDGRGAPILFYLLPYTLMTFGAFAILAGLGRERSEDETFESFRGMSQSRPFLAFTVLVFMVSLAGIPPTAGFWGKFYLFREAVNAGEWELALIGIITSVISVYYYVRLVVVMYMQSADADASAAPSFQCGWGAGVALALAAAGVVGIGLLPGNFLELSVRSIRTVVIGP